MLFAEKSGVPAEFEKAYVKRLKNGQCACEIFRQEFMKSTGQVVSNQRMHYYIYRLLDYGMIKLIRICHKRGIGNIYALTPRGIAYYEEQGII